MLLHWPRVYAVVRRRTTDAWQDRRGSDNSFACSAEQQLLQCPATRLWLGQLQLAAADRQTARARRRCCHGSRDARCGALGEPLAARLAAAARELGLSEAAVRVLRCSHIGGHKVRRSARQPGSAPTRYDWPRGRRAAPRAQRRAG